MVKQSLHLFLVAIVAFGLMAFSGPDPVPSEAPGPVAAKTAEKTVTIKPVGDQMKFETTAFSVEPGETVTIVFENTATSPAMQHNVVVLTTEDAINRVGQAAVAAGPGAEYVPEDDAILAYTPLAQPGETVEVTFTAPSEPGDYPYICTFPGHYMMMQGTMTVGN